MTLLFIIAGLVILNLGALALCDSGKRRDYIPPLTRRANVTRLRNDGKEAA